MASALHLHRRRLLVKHIVGFARDDGERVCTIPRRQGLGFLHDHTRSR
jgi:hypothetical protein